MLAAAHLLRFVTAPLARHIHMSRPASAKVAVVLSGCGVYDGSEVHEASAVMVHLSRGGADVAIFAPDVDQMHVINHTKGEPMEEKRNVLVESARIARGKIAALSTLDVAGHDAVILPGGFGAAKNLCTFAVDGADCKVNPEVEKTIKSFHDAKKPIGLCCIAPVLAAKLIPGCSVTVGNDQEEGGRWPYAGTAGAVGKMGATHIRRDVNEVHVDTANKIVTTPAFMCETKLHEIYDGIGHMVKEVLDMV
ncbi:glutamine amidotransferase-like class 1 domain-containing protein 3A, mitochondrial isoform X1 [Branchiostoma floridae]|uniref:Glutamine amidotransferase-like class 1 domain-containing protein 3A, mitochondrial isoform X1 n=1 Tax=Branchiostoma floridae TaxID=7739 RepID=A0A9J7MMF1_BRAFL|nr:glutamine amidotransferase-like class 1 domain-containing protein 3A, mitochondrial isoform X1 [Branchiostoma floridae]